MWRSLHKLLHSRPTQNYTEDECSTLVNSFNSFFISKITKIHESIANTLASSPISPFPTRQFSGTPTSVLQPVSSEEVLKLIPLLPNKSSPLDSLPTTLLKKYALILSPILSKLANLSFSTGTFPSIFKKAQVLPLLKKPNLDPTSPANYRPISNLSTMSKLLERLLSRLRPHITTSSNFSSFQSAYRPGFSTETALLHIFNNLSDICGKGNCAVMVGLDLSAAFDTINHQLLLERLKSDFGIDGLAFSWLQSYLSNRTQYVKLGNHSSSPVELLAGVPQGSVLGPLLLTTYTYTPVQHNSWLRSIFPSIRRWHKSLLYPLQRQHVWSTQKFAEVHRCNQWLASCQLSSIESAEIRNHVHRHTCSPKNYVSPNLHKRCRHPPSFFYYS